MFSGWGLSWGGWLNNRRGEWWLLGQLFLVCAHLLPVWPQTSSLGVPNWPWQLNLLGALLLSAGLCLVIQALLSLGSSLSPLPEPKQGNRLVCSGAFKRCRHPIYQAVLLCSLGVVVGVGSLLHLPLFLLLVVVLGGKARREERILRTIHPDYDGYKRSTPAIIPKLPWLDWQ